MQVSMPGAHAKVEDLKAMQTAIINLSKVLNDVDGNITHAIQKVHIEWDDELFCAFNETYNKYKQRLIEIAEQYEKFATGPLQTKIEQLIDIEKIAKKI